MHRKTYMRRKTGKCRTKRYGRIKYTRCKRSNSCKRSNGCKRIKRNTRRKYMRGG